MTADRRLILTVADVLAALPATARADVLDAIRERRIVIDPRERRPPP